MAKGLPRSLKNAKPTATKPGVAVQMPFQANSAGVPTQAEFNALLTKLKNAGLMAAS